MCCPKCDRESTVELCLIPVHLAERQDLGADLSQGTIGDRWPHADRLGNVHAWIRGIKLDASLRVERGLIRLDRQHGSSERRCAAIAEDVGGFPARDPDKLQRVNTTL